jgi:uncharacterized protein YjcR
MALSNDQKRQWAEMLYCKLQLTQKEVAEKVDVSPITVNRWVEKYHWKAIRDSILMTKEAELSRVRQQLSSLNDMIMERDINARYPTTSEADIQIKLSTTIKNLTTEVEIDQIIDVGSDFIDWLKPTDYPKAQEFTELFDAFITHKLKNRR